MRAGGHLITGRFLGGSPEPDIDRIDASGSSPRLPRRVDFARRAGQILGVKEEPSIATSSAGSSSH